VSRTSRPATEPDAPPDASLDTPRAFRTYVARVTPRVVTYLRWLGVAESDYSDVMQEVLIIASRRRASFDPSRGKYEAWTYGIVLREVQNHRRTKGRKGRNILPLRPDKVPDSALVGAHGEDRFMQRDTLLRCLRTLPEEQAVMFLAYEVEGLDYRELAAAHGISPSTAFERVKDARARLKAEVERLQDKQRKAGLAVLPLTLAALLRSEEQDDEVPESTQRRIDRTLERLESGDIGDPGLGRRTLEALLGPRGLPALALAIGAAGGAGVTYELMRHDPPEDHPASERAPVSAVASATGPDSERRETGTAPAESVPPPTLPMHADAGVVDIGDAEEVAFKRAALAYDRGDYQEAIKGFQRHAARFPGGHVTGRERLWTFALIALGRTSEAHKRIEQLRRSNPDGDLLKEFDERLPPEP
jgi:RNA polymerase sigma factor (sigma-70 family)